MIKTDGVDSQDQYNRKFWLASVWLTLAPVPAPATLERLYLESQQQR